MHRHKILLWSNNREITIQKKISKNPKKRERKLTHAKLQNFVIYVFIISIIKNNITKH